LGGRKGIRPVKTEWWGAGVVICLEQGADLHMTQLMPLPLTVSCFSKIHIDFAFLVLAHLGSPGKGPLTGVCVCVCVCVSLERTTIQTVVLASADVRDSRTVVVVVVVSESSPVIHVHPTSPRSTTLRVVNNVPWSIADVGSSTLVTVGNIVRRSSNNDLNLCSAQFSGLRLRVGGC